MIVGVYAGALSVPRLARPHYLEHLKSLLHGDAEEFRGYHPDASSIEDTVDDSYLDPELSRRLPRMPYGFLDDVLQVGFGWVATRTCEYHDEVLAIFTPLALWKSRNHHRYKVKAVLREIVNTDHLDSGQ
jgi:hypothetical protein